MRQRLVADQLIPMDGRVPIIETAALDIDDDTITWSGPLAEAPEPADRTIVRLRGALVPGMINAHAHTPMVLLRTLGEGLPVDRWLTEVIWPREARLQPEDVEVAMTLGLAEQVRNGITTTAEMYFHPDAMGRAVDSVGTRSLLTGPVIDDDQLAGFGTWEAQLVDSVRLRDRWASHPRIDIGLGPHAAYSLSERALREVGAVAVAEGLFIHIHVAEQRGEGDGVTARTGLSVPAYLESIGMLEARVIAAHCVWIDQADIEILAASTVGVAHCPCSNTKHASGIAPVESMRAAGLPVGIATDGPSSHARLDLFEEMRTAIRLARVSTLDAMRLPATTAYRMVTSEAARAIGRSDLGTLGAGSKADVVLLDLDRPEFSPAPHDGDDDLVARIVWNGSPSAVDSVWVGGRRLLQSGVPTGVDLEAVAHRASLHAHRLAEDR